jgi:hypothetical protein
MLDPDAEFFAKRALDCAHMALKRLDSLQISVALNHHRMADFEAQSAIRWTLEACRHVEIAEAFQRGEDATALIEAL